MGKRHACYNIYKEWIASSAHKQRIKKCIEYGLESVIGKNHVLRMRKILGKAKEKIHINELSRVVSKARLRFTGIGSLNGYQTYDPKKSTLLVASHEASATGAPILALNICTNLSKDYNVIVYLQRKEGRLVNDFQNSSIKLLFSDGEKVSSPALIEALLKATNGRLPELAIINSIVSWPPIIPLRSQGIPCILLLHEFVTYIKPLELVTMVGLWSSRIICSTQLTWNDILRHCKHLANVPIEIIPQGRCQAPYTTRKILFSGLQPKQPQDDKATHFLRNLPKNTLLVLGAGAVQPRKGVDLFVSIASQIVNQDPKLDVHFAWIGSGYDPSNDFNLGIWLKDQIERSGLSERLTMLEESLEYHNLIARSNIFIVSSRLDPLPNVGIDAMLAGSPVLCFAEACGIANLIEQETELYSSCVASYLDCTALAQKAIALLRSPQRLEEISAITKQKAKQWFHMPTYIRELLKIGGLCTAEVYQEDMDLKLLLSKKAINSQFYNLTAKNETSLYRKYLMEWRSNIRPRKPVPEFHPGIYRENQMPHGSKRDPLAHWLENECPTGPWKVQLIEPTSPLRSLPEPGKVALHIHVFYPELLSPILDLLAKNSIQPDLFISYSNSIPESTIKRILSNHGCIADLFPTPNRGRDIAPLLKLGQHLDKNYDYHGHLHTKKSVLIDNNTATCWREFLVTNLIGDTNISMADKILSALHNNPELGLVFPSDPHIIDWTQNRKYADELAAKINLKTLPEAIDFPVGTMFWTRSGALSRLYQLKLTFEDFPVEPIGYDGTILHAIERLLPQICLSTGFQYALTHVPGISR